MSTIDSLYNSSFNGNDPFSVPDPYDGSYDINTAATINVTDIAPELKTLVINFAKMCVLVNKMKGKINFSSIPVVDIAEMQSHRAQILARSVLDMYDPEQIS